ncbi:NTE family protein [Oceanobacillus limi]|uniref:NTE family protein n=1 Tax=Oceanobacillus limi TaxID=930131 RepID=A0A1H9ZNB2_9BACI|nr:patatin-like phospholipase family protein [Oceanobacillus limi]SES83120.1 NTE family protein [Oceanobacillus limi]
MKIDAVFSGGGVKAFAFIGALESMEEKNLELERVAGTSAGAILAALLAAGYHYKEINAMLEELDLKTFFDPPTFTKLIPGSKWLLLYFQNGIYKGDKFEKWLQQQLAKKGIYTFRDIKESYLKVVVSDLTLGKLVVIPDDLERIYGIDPNHFPVSMAVRMSAGFPYFFMPKKLSGKTKDKSVIVDGGLLSNFPLWVFDQEHHRRKRPVLGVKLSDSTEVVRPRRIKNALEMLHALFSTMKQAHDARYVSTSKRVNIIFIPVKNVDTTDFTISQDVKQRLVEEGKVNAKQFLNYWSP